MLLREKLETVALMDKSIFNLYPYINIFREFFIN